MRRAFHRSMPFFRAVLIGAMACAVVAGVALFIAHP
jgi:hypothetical protein